jgi:hypothetical protein
MTSVRQENGTIYDGTAAVNKYRFAYDLTITITCTDSDGNGPISGSGTLPHGPFWFKLQTDQSGNVTTVPGSPAQ